MHDKHRERTSAAKQKIPFSVYNLIAENSNGL
jgi:hypothetical protein